MCEAIRMFSSRWKDNRLHGGTTTGTTWKFLDCEFSVNSGETTMQRLIGEFSVFPLVSASAVS